MNVDVRAARADDYQAFYDICNCPGVVRNTLELPYVLPFDGRQRLAAPIYSEDTDEVLSSILGVTARGWQSRGRRVPSWAGTLWRILAGWPC